LLLQVLEDHQAEEFVLGVVVKGELVEHSAKVFYVVGNTRNAPCDPDTGLLKLPCQEDERRSGALEPYDVSRTGIL
jgi:hypothetical protein